MSPADAVWVVLGAAIGAPLRYYTDRLIQRRATAFPLGTLTVNSIGSGLLGFLTMTTIPGWAHAAIGVGFCGALTTYSTFGYETTHLAEHGSVLYATTNVIANLTAGLTAALLGAAIAANLTPP